MARSRRGQLLGGCDGGLGGDFVCQLNGRLWINRRDWRLIHRRQEGCVRRSELDQPEHFLRFGKLHLRAHFKLRARADQKRNVEHNVDRIQHCAGNSGLAFGWRGAVDGLIDVQSHVRDAGANQRQRQRPAHRCHRTEYFQTGTQITDPEFFAQLTVGSEYKVRLGNHGRTCRLAQPSECVTADRDVAAIDHLMIAVTPSAH
ncbi:hypothetical protein D3C81_1380360 [compost metagenome]